ncbi:MAG: sulfur carrier protein ThiS [Synergistaceae bacterium]|nr:sulfur carrier protein ThiS [Synergistaceae bacterium]
MIRVNGELMEWKEGMTIQDILDLKGYTFPMLAVWVNDTPRKKEEFACTIVPDGSEVQAFHMISGG